jgi:alkylresorcinol/alkylpyrone synthase
MVMARRQADGPCIPAVSIAGIGTALPPRCFSQADTLAWGLAHVPMPPATRELYEKVLGDPGIATRHLAVDDLSELLETNHDTIIARFERRAGELSAHSLARALEVAGVEAASVDFLAATTCTGYLCPGLTSYVMERRFVRTSVGSTWWGWAAAPRCRHSSRPAISWRRIPTARPRW